MIGIRECIDIADLNALLSRHKIAVGAEVEKRIDFYINLFDTLEYLRLHPGTHLNTIKLMINKYVHHKQYVPFTGHITLNPNKFTAAKYNSLKKATFLKAEARSFTNIATLLRELKHRAKSIIILDLNLGKKTYQDYYDIIKAKFAPLDFLLGKIFDYDWFINREPVEPEWGPYQLTKGLGLKVCPYCNRQYTFTLSKNVKKVTKPELDHFLPQVYNPLLRLTFFNLVPSCTVCNRDLKGKIEFNYDDYLSPYEANVGHKFLNYDYLPETYLGSIGETDEIRVFLKTPGVALPSTTLKKVKGNLNVFEYKILANEHKDIVREIIKRRILSNDNYLQMIINLFPGATLTLDEAYRLAYGNFYSEKEFSKRPLAKLMKDIAIEVGALKPYKS